MIHIYTTTTTTTTYTGLLLIASGGLHVAFSVWDPVVGDIVNNFVYLLPLVVLHVAAMAGSCVGASIVLQWRTRSIYVSENRTQRTRVMMVDGMSMMVECA